MVVTGNDGRLPASRKASRTGPHSITDELVIFNHPQRGRTLAVLPVIPDGAPYQVREGIARRRLVALTGQCSCGATVDGEALRHGLPVLQVEHDSRCPAVTGRLRRAIRRWTR